MNEILTETLKKLNVGEMFEYTGKLIVMRDAAQKRLVEMEDNGKTLPVELKNALVFYAGPTFSKGNIIIGPTTSKRMDRFLEFLGRHGVIGTIGKGERTPEGVETIKKYKMIYFVTPSGCAAYLGKKIKSWKVVAFEDLGPEAVYEIEVENFPLLVVISAL
ncbi:FumA C-terminus/TtdB family hydratase beta subunit [Fervidobacterium nodosum]|uniref:Fe-S type hydro-lyase tartrate/fumarate beta region n=1 Tax=Fervidobacterium nodosum (strain ATCC 35602 / DSM 5306 / Rt17-B1) TaxID=381764 RepID=A7HKF0_FERNB|nr:FumA C-terminus/TtdB family hydratase beta subunit [Fervidobacterium nodosum]ABS60383.1 Fe-S type hydro-lyase tartrate/fumarate beta region [Fervidobacterium nodosum Rt17-B1]HOJ94172.1 FumA C-terminus/TtdB family hydratase beta subunit [Fervidobacterium nodosum]